MRYVYLFHEGNARMKELLGGKGANLAEMTNIGLPVPCGMTITTDACREYYNNGKMLPEGLVEEVTRNLKAIEEEAGKRFGDEDDPLLLSVRSGAVFSMPGMMDTILNLGLNAATFKALARHTGNMWFACDTYRRFIQMFSDVVMEIPKDKFEHILQEQKAAQGVTQDQELSVESLLAVIDKSKALYRQEIEEDFPEDVTRQLFLSIEAVFRSWNNHRAIVYRNLNKIDHNLGTAVNIQAMVFGNMAKSIVIYLKIIQVDHSYTCRQHFVSELIFIISSVICTCQCICIQFLIISGKFLDQFFAPVTVYQHIIIQCIDHFHNVRRSVNFYVFGNHLIYFAIKNLQLGLL